MDESSAGDVGVATALGRICALEAKLRQAIQHTHLLSSSFESDPAAADREREALLAIREQLELLEDKLRDFRCLRDNQYDDKTVALSQLDSLRRELIACARDRLEFLVFTKDVVREVLTFAEVNSGSSTPDHSTARQDHRPPLSPLQRSLDGTYSPLMSPAASPSPKLRKLQNPLRGSYNEAVHLPVPTPVAARDRRVSQSLDFSRLERSENVPGPSQAPRQSLVGRRMAADAAQRTLDAADSIIFSGHKRNDKSSKKSHSPMLSPGQVRDEALYSTTNGGSRYNFDPDYGGKVSMPKAHAYASIRPDSLHPRHAPDASRPRALFADDRSGHGGSIRGDDETCSLPATTWSGQQARTPIAVRRLGPLPTAPSPHHPKDPNRHTAWLGRIAKLAALGTIVIVSAAGVVKAVDWHNAPAQKQQRAARQAHKQLRKEQAEHEAWLRAQARKAQLAERAEKEAQVQKKREAEWQLRQEQLQAMQQAREEEQAAEAARQQLLVQKQQEAAQQRRRMQQARAQAAAEEEHRRQVQLQGEADVREKREQEARQQQQAEAARQLRQQQELERQAKARQEQDEQQQRLLAEAQAAKELKRQQESERQARIKEEEQRQQQLLAEAQAAKELKRQREIERQARVKEEEQQQQQLLADAKARREYQRQQQLLQEQAEAKQQQQRQQQQQAELQRKQQQQADLHRKQQQQHEQAMRQQQEEAAAATDAEARQAALKREADVEAKSVEADNGQSEVLGDVYAQGDSPSQAPVYDSSKERNWKSADHWLPQRGAPKVTVVGKEPKGWPVGAAFPALPPPNIFRGQG